MSDTGRAVAIVLLRWTRVAGVAVLAFGANAAPAFGAEPHQTVLTCTNLVSGFGWQIKIDFEARTVDSNPARISSATISWHDGSDGGNYTLDRKSGNLTVIFASSTGGYFLYDHCKPQS